MLSQAAALAHGRDRLTALGIATTDDLDRWIKAHPYKDKWGRAALHSRFGAIKALAGEDAAVWVLNDLAIRQCCRAL